MFSELPYESKLEVCRLYYNLNYYTKHLPDPTVRFSWRYVLFETSSVNVTYVPKQKILEWYNKNIKIIRKHKLISITKREMVVGLTTYLSLY